MRRKPHSTSLVLLLVCIFAFWWGISVWVGHTTVSTTTTASAPATASDASVQDSDALKVTEAKSGDTYTFNGSLPTLTECDGLGSGISYEGSTNKVTILLTTSKPVTACAQAASADAPAFSVSIKHPGAAPLFGGVRLNGTLVPAQLVQS